MECVEYDSTTRQHVSRRLTCEALEYMAMLICDLNSYVPGLERRIAYLESKLRANGIDDADAESTRESTGAQSTSSIPWSGTTPPEILSGGSTEMEESRLDPDARALVDRVVTLARSRPGHDLSFPQVLLTELMRSANFTQPTRPEGATQEVTDMQFPSNIAGDLDTSAVTLPTEDTAQSLVKAYFEFANVAMPLLHEPSFRREFDLAYRMPHIISLTGTHSNSNSRIAVFFVLEVFAVALIRVQKQDPSRMSTWLADRYHRTALSALSLASLPDGVQGVQALLLVAQYSYLHPNPWDAWRAVGAALRLAVELGLHQEGINGLDPLAIDTRRRTFWVAYSMDRNLSAAMSMPYGLSDGAISTKVYGSFCSWIRAKVICSFLVV